VIALVLKIVSVLLPLLVKWGQHLLDPPPQTRGRPRSRERIAKALANADVDQLSTELQSRLDRLHQARRDAKR